jgi:predicted nucleotidyltransferase
MPSLPPPVRVAVQEYRHALENMLPGRVRRITVFGSVARGEANEDSDLDILVLLDAPSFQEKARAIDHATEIGLRHDLVLAPVVLSLDQWQELEQRERSFPREVTRDGIDA